MSKPESDTPRTDSCTNYHEFVKLCGTLERELAALKAQRVPVDISRQAAADLKNVAAMLDSLRAFEAAAIVRLAAGKEPAQAQESKGPQQGRPAESVLDGNREPAPAAGLDAEVESFIECLGYNPHGYYKVVLMKWIAIHGTWNRSPEHCAQAIEAMRKPTPA